MYQSAQLLLNYIQRPELGTNSFNMNNSKGDDIIDDGYIETKNNTRKINNNKKQKSFFEQIDEL